MATVTARGLQSRANQETLWAGAVPCRNTALGGRILQEQQATKVRATGRVPSAEAERRSEIQSLRARPDDWSHVCSCFAVSKILGLEATWLLVLNAPQQNKPGLARPILHIERQKTHFPFHIRLKMKEKGRARRPDLRSVEGGVLWSGRNEGVN